MHGRLAARFEGGDRNHLTELRWRPPLQALRALDAADGAAELVISTLGPGVMGGDDLIVTIDVGPDTHARVTTTGATRVLPTRSRGSATAFHLLNVEGGALLEWLPRPTILQTDAALRQTTHLHLAPGAAALLVEVLVPGRLAAGERFAFAELDATLEVRCDHHLVVAERQRAQPSGRDLLPGADCVLATLFVLAPGRQLPSLPEATELPNQAGLLIRALCASASAAEALLQPAIEQVRVALAPAHSAFARSLCARSGAAGHPSSVR